VDLKETWENEYQKELSRAISANMEGNEGMARVCARRAARIIIGEYLHRQGYTHLDRSIYGRLEIFNMLPGITSNQKKVANHFLLKVDLDHRLPGEVDLVRDVQWLANSLLMEEQK
jgi:hypothetical protein